MWKTVCEDVLLQEPLESWGTGIRWRGDRNGQCSEIIEFLWEMVSKGSKRNEKEQYQSMVRFLFLEGESHSKINERLVTVYDESCPSLKIGLMSLKVVARRFWWASLKRHANGYHDRLGDKNPRFRISRSRIESARGSWDSWASQKTAWIVSSWNFRHEKAVDIAHSTPQARPLHHFRAAFEAA